LNKLKEQYFIDHNIIIQYEITIDSSKRD